MPPISSEPDSSPRCPSEDVLARFCEGRLHGDALDALQAHIDGCDACMELLAELGRDEAVSNAADVATLVSLPGDDEARPAPLPAIGSRLGRYVVLAPIGAGGMGVVFAGYDPEIDRKVALKLVRMASDASDERRRRLIREARAMGQLSHPNVVAVYDVGTSDAGVFVAMEFIEGQTLSAWIEGIDDRAPFHDGEGEGEGEDEAPPRSGRLHPWGEVLEVFGQTGRGLAAAHDQGLVHRDFKPGNVMIGRDGRVRVLDFGLARLSRATISEGGSPTPAAGSNDGAAAPDDVDATRDAIVGSEGPPEPAEATGLQTPSPAGSLITRVGAILGTPAYMAPEQYAGRVADARSDQFSFCVALYEALYGMRPFRGTTLATLATKVLAGAIRPPPRSSRVPAWVRRAVLRGLAREPAERWPDMHALLRALDPAPHRRRRWAAAIAAGAVTLAGVYALAMPAAVAPCQSAAEHLDGIWDDDRRTRVEQAFAETAAPFQADMWRTVHATLDGYAQRWTEAHTDACRATHVHHEQSAEALDLRMGCLRKALREVDTVVELLTDADADLVGRSVTLSTGLPSIDRCADLEALRADVPPPEDPEIAAQAETLERALMQARVLNRAGRYGDGLTLAEETIAQADALGYTPLRARARAEAGMLHRSKGEFARAEERLTDAYWMARPIGDDRVIVAAETALVFVVGYRLQRFDEGHLWARHAAADIERTGDDPELWRELHENHGSVYMAAHDNPQAAEAFETALALSRELYGDDPRTALALGNLASIYTRLERFDRAIEYHREAIAVLERILGPLHPTLTDTLSNLAIAYSNRGDPDEAVPLLERAIEIGTAVWGPRSIRVAGPRVNLGMSLIALGRYDAARRELSLALEIFRETYGPDHTAVGTTLANLGDLAFAQRDWATADARYVEAVAIFEDKLGHDHPELVELLHVMAWARLELDRIDDAEAIVEWAEALCAGGQVLPHWCAMARFSRARLLTRDPATRAEGLQRARQAREVVARSSPKHPQLANMDAWLAAH